MTVRTRLSLYGGVGRPYNYEQGDGPAPFSFVSQLGIALSQTGVESNQVVINSVTPGSAITITGSAGAEYSLNGGAWVSTAGTVNNGDTLRVRVNSSASYNTGTQATVTINEVVESFVVVTIKDPNPVVAGRAPITRLHARR
jgi:hypothetical protein